MRILKKSYVLLFICFPLLSYAQPAYFVDGFHGGIWGHYPEGYTSFIVEQLKNNPNWNINLEIEPETWNRELRSDLSGYNSLKQLLQDTSVNSRVEYVNPAFGQPYMFNISGESIIRQFSYGMRMLKAHFPSITFKTYSSEEPCFTSALPQILKSYGFKYASLKNPNTAWGGYTRAYGKELVNWIGPDETSILTSPRYSIEDLTKGSTWETIANNNSYEFVNKAFNDGIKNPVGMCLQDAEWRFGPWLRGDFYEPTIYTTWRNYFENIANIEKASDWKFSQEDVLVSLVWGSQVMQRLSQQIRTAENKIVQAEKFASINRLENNGTYPSKAIDEAWRGLMLAQHHDCWIVPYNGKKGDTWADKVTKWTTTTNRIADSVFYNQTTKRKSNTYFKVYNTLGRERNEWVSASIPDNFKGVDFVIVDENNKENQYQIVKGGQVVFKAQVPALGYSVFQIKRAKKNIKNAGASIVFNNYGDCILETDLYKITIDKTKGGTIKSLLAKTLSNKEFVDINAERKFNELRGNFYKKGGFHSNTNKPATISVLEEGPHIITVAVASEIAGNPVIQKITLKQGQPLIECNLQIDWKQNEGIGEFEETNYKDTTLHKAFYDDKYKLLTLFPLALKNQKVYKNAPFDVTESKLDNTFFNSWDNIKNNVILSWVDIVSEDHQFGLTMFSDHTTSYTHGEKFPLGLTTQYSGKGLWGRNYRIDSITNINYNLMPHQGNWQQADVSYVNEKIKEPLKVVLTHEKPKVDKRSFIGTSSGSLEVSSLTYHEKELYLRVFNSANSAIKGKVNLNFKYDKAVFVNLDGSLQEKSEIISASNRKSDLSVELRPFEFKTIKISR